MLFRSIVDFLMAWIIRSADIHAGTVPIVHKDDSTPGGGVGEVEGKKRVKSDTESPAKSRVSTNGVRLHPGKVKWVKSVGVSMRGQSP